MHEERRARLHRLADSINDTARMARTSLSIMLLVALYLGLTLVASTDQNLLLDGQVTLPQMGAGISVAESYIFAPPIFLYLHIQLLFLLSVLARKILTFEAALKKEFPDALLPHPQNKTDAERRECWEWLSAFAFVQLFRRTPGGRPVLKMVARTLAWFGIEAAPLALLFLIAVSFVRYQSAGITWSHHCIFILDSVAIMIFNRFVFRRRNRIRGSASASVAAPGNAGVPPAFGMGQKPALSGRIDRLMHYRIWWKHLRGLSAICLNWRIIVRSAKVMPARLWTSVGGTGIVSLCMALLLVCAAHPPQFDPQKVENDRLNIWREDDKEFRQTIREFCRAVWRRGENPLDAGPCRWWGFGCRYLDVRKKWLLGTQPQDLLGQILDESTSETDEDIRRFHFGSPDLAGRRFRFARFGSTYLPSADLHQTELQGADLRLANLQGAYLRGAELQGAHLVRAELQGANLLNAKLYGADLAGAKLQGAYLRRAALQGARLASAKLQGANLSNARLHGADLTRAELRGVDLFEAKLQGADLTGAELEGTSLTRAELQGSKGRLASWYPTWMPDVKFNFSGPLEQYLKKLLSDEKIRKINLAWEKDTPLEKHLEQSLSSGSGPVIFSDVKPGDTGTVFYKPKDKNWKGKNCFDVSGVHSDDCYWDAWAEWTADFACENEYTARSSLQRWSLPRDWDPPDTPFSLDKDISDRARNKVREALFNARKEPKCAGLRDLSENEWQVFVDG